jgi:hypothetical protein
MRFSLFNMVSVPFVIRVDDTRRRARGSTRGPDRASRLTPSAVYSNLRVKLQTRN